MVKGGRVTQKLNYQFLSSLSILSPNHRMMKKTQEQEYLRPVAKVHVCRRIQSSVK